MAQNEIPNDIDLSLSTMGWIVDRFSKSWMERISELKEKIDSSKNNEDDYIYHKLRNEVKKIIVKGEKPDEATFKVN